MHLPAQCSLLVGLSGSTCGGMEKPLNKHFKRERHTHTYKGSTRGATRGATGTVTLRVLLQ